MSSRCGHHQDQLLGTSRGHFTTLRPAFRGLGCISAAIQSSRGRARQFHRSTGNSLCGMTLGDSKKKGQHRTLRASRATCQKANKSVKGLSVMTRPGPAPRSRTPNPQANPKYFSLWEMRRLQGFRVTLADTSFGSGERDALIGNRRGHV